MDWKLTTWSVLTVVFVVVTVVTILCSIFSNCVLCKFYPVRISLRPVIQKSTENFDDAPTKKLVVVYATWCGFCKSLLSDVWPDVEQSLLGNPNIEVDKIDAENPVNANLVASIGADIGAIKSYPTIAVYNGNNWVRQYGDRTSADIVKFALAQ